jgi:hypothetical protein
MVDLLAAQVFGELTSEAVDTLLARYDDALAALAIDEATLAEIKLAKDVLGIGGSESATRLNLSVIGKQLTGQLRKFPIAAMLATAFEHGHGYADDYDRLTAWATTASLVLMARQPGHESKIETGCAAVRLIRKYRELDTMSRFAGHCATAGTIRKTALNNEVTQRGTLSGTRFEDIRILFDSYIDGKDAILRARDGDVDYDDVYYVTQSAPVAIIDLDDELGNGADTARTVAYLHSNGDHINPEHSQHRIEADVPAVGSGAALHVRAHQALRRTAIVHSTIRRRLALPCQYGAFTPYEIGLILKAIATFANGASGSNWRANVLIVAGLITGRTPAEFQALPRTRGTRPRDATQWIEIGEDCVALCYEPFRKRMQMSGLERQLLYPEDPQPLRLTLPTDIARPLQRLWIERLKDSIDNAEIDRAFASLLPKQSRPQTLRRMASVIRDRIVQAGHDSAIAAYIAGDSQQNIPALYYVTLENERVEAAYRQAVSSLRPEPFTWPAANRHHVGSSLLVQERRIQAFYKYADAELRNLAVGSLDDVIAVHNRYTILVCSSLMLLTGHRPVRQPFERITDFDLDRALLFIADKEQRTVASGRFIPLASIAVQQVRAWLDHIHHLPSRLGLLDHTFVRSCARAISGDDPLFFQLRRHSDEPLPELVAVTPKMLIDDLQRIWPLPLNWGRHVQRRLLTSLPSELVDAFMGHADPGAEAFATHSGLSFHDLGELRDALDKVAGQLRARVFPAAL